MAEQAPDPWRILWRFATSNELLVALLIAIAASLTLTTWLPQRPSSAVDYARWLSQTQARFGEAAPVMRTLGLFSIIPSLAFRILLALLAGCVLLQVVEGVDRVRRDQEVAEPSGSWQKIPGEELAELVSRLRRRRYRVVGGSCLFQVDRWPWSSVLSLMARLGALLLLLSLLLSHFLGWQVQGLVLQMGERRSLPGEGNWVSLAEDGGETHQSPGVVTFIEERGPGVRVSASGEDGRALELLLRSEAEPSTELNLALTGDVDFAVPEAELIVRLTPQSDEPYARADVQIYSSPTGEIISERVTDEGGQAVLSLGGVMVTLNAAPYARVVAIYNPGRWWAGLGLSMLTTGLVGSLLWSGYRFWLREEGDSLEAGGAIPPWLLQDDGAC